MDRQKEGAAPGKKEPEGCRPQRPYHTRRLMVSNPVFLALRQSAVGRGVAQDTVLYSAVSGAAPSFRLIAFGLSPLVCLLGVVSWPSTGCATPAAAHKPALTTPVPFSLVDTNGKTQSLAEQRGHPVALFFFCGCTWCAALARQWGQLQQQGALDQGNIKNAPVTMVVFSGDADSVKSFASETGLDLKQTILLPDPTMKVTLAYKSDTCPRVFVINPTGAVTYTNNHKDDLARQASAQVIAYLALSEVRARTNKS